MRVIGLTQELTVEGLPCPNLELQKILMSEHILDRTIEC